MIFITYFLIFFIGGLIGCVGAGGVFIIPILERIMGLTTHSAMGTALFSFIFTGILGTILYTVKKSMNWIVAIPLCLGSVATAYAGTWLNHYVSGQFLNILLAGIIIFSGLCSLKPRTSACAAGSHESSSQNFFQVLLIGAVVGFLCGMTGAGGPILSVPIMIAVGFPVLPTIAASQALQIALSSAGSIGNLQNGSIDFSIAWWVILLEVCGAAVGVMTAHRLKGDILRKVVAVVCVGVGFLILINSTLLV